MRRPLRYQSHQLKLFHRPPKVPDWQSLSAEVRQRAAALLARLLQEHRVASLHAPQAKEVCDE